MSAFAIAAITSLASGRVDGCSIPHMRIGQGREEPASELIVAAAHSVRALDSLEIILMLCHSESGIGVF